MIIGWKSLFYALHLMSSADLAPVEIRCYFVRQRNCLLVRGKFSDLYMDYYLHLMQHEGQKFTREMVVRGTLERVVPVLMTALAAGIALIPLILAADEPGKEILHPVAVAIVGGLISSTLLTFLVTPAVFFATGRRAAATALEIHGEAFE